MFFSKLSPHYANGLLGKTARKQAAVTFRTWCLYMYIDACSISSTCIRSGAPTSC